VLRSGYSSLYKRSDIVQATNGVAMICQLVLQSNYMKLNEAQINQYLSQTEDWRREGDMLVRDFKFPDFKSAMGFVNRVADESEALDHHPDILIHGWNNVRLSVTTHSDGGLTEKDFKLAERINRL
jgi:4a-hydroxytetrahydrobiopterin dehydratase